MENLQALKPWTEYVVAWMVGPGYADPRTKDWPLMDWPVPFAIFLIYSLGIPIGIRIMRDRPPFKVKTFAMVHNLTLFLLSLYMSIECWRQAHTNFRWGERGFRLYCNQNDALSPDGGKIFSDSGAALARVLYIHYLSKAYEFVDTLIMILKKNTRQISFLHVYHHATTFFPVWWAVVRYGPGGDAWFCCFLNSAIHVGMYGYYFASTCGLRLAVVKPLITMSQMIQFLAFLYQCTVFFTLFTNFFVRTYLLKSRSTNGKPKKA